MSDDLTNRALNERRLGLLIMENKSGAALAAGVTHLKNAADLWGQAEQGSRRAECLSDLARLYSKLERFAEAAETWLEALRIYQSGTDRNLACDAASGAGMAYLAAGVQGKAERYLRLALEFSREQNDHIRIAQNRLDLARVLLARKDGCDAINEVTEALVTFDDYRKRIKSAECHEVLGAAYAVDGVWEKARQHYEESAGISMELGRPFEASETLSRFADVEAERGNADGAIVILERGLELQKSVNNKALMAQTHRLIGTMRARKGETDLAASAYQRSLDLCEVLGDEAGKARALYQLGSLYADQGDFDAAKEHLDESMSAADKAHIPRIKERALACMARLYRKAEVHDKALETMHRWVDVLKELGERQEQLKVLGSIAKVHQERGALDEAEAHLRRLISVCSRPEDEAEMLFAQHGLAVLLAKRGENQEAAVYFQRAVDGYCKSGVEDNPGRLAKIQYQYGNCLLLLGRTREAQECYRQAAPLFEAEKDEKGLARALVGMGNAHIQLGQEGLAKDFFDKAAVLCEQHGDLRATRIIRRATGAP